MCEECWAEYGCPSEVTPEVKMAATAIQVTLKHQMDGGNLFPILDWSFDDETLNLVITDIQRDEDTPKDRLNSERVCVRLLQEMPIVQRATTIALVQGYLEPKTNDQILREELAKLADDLGRARKQLLGTLGPGEHKKILRDVEKSLRKLSKV